MKQKLILLSSLAALVSAYYLVTSSFAAPPRDLRGFMRVKLRQSQNGLEGLVLGDFAAVAKNAEEMKALSLDETWQVMTTPQYVEQSLKFRTATDALSAAAKKNDLEKSTIAFNQVTTRCVECHKYVRDVRMAKAGP